MSLTDKARKGIAWGTIERLSTQGVGVVFAILLARVLSPDDYGTIAMPMVFFGIAQTLMDAGFSRAIIRKKDLKDEDLSTSFYFQLIVGIACYAALYAASPWIADFYNKPILASLLKVSALVMVINPLCATQYALLMRDINFKAQALVNLTGRIITGLIGLILAYSGYGIWALVFQQLAGSLWGAIVLWTFSPWRPRTGWSGESFRYLWNYGSNLLASSLLDTAYNNIFPVVIGKYYSAASLAYYNSANQLAAMPAMTLSGIVGRVTFPLLCKMQDDTERLAHNYRRMLKLSAFVLFPIMTILAVVAPALIRLTIGPQWEGTIPLLQILCFALMLYPLHAININLLKVRDNTRQYLHLEVAKKVVSLTILAFTIWHGVLWMVLGNLLFSWIALAINTYYTGKIINLGYFRQMRDVLPALVTSVVACLAAYLVVSLTDSSLLQLLAGGLTGGGLYLSLAWLFMREQFHDVLILIRTK